MIIRGSSVIDIDIARSIPRSRSIDIARAGFIASAVSIAFFNESAGTHAIAFSSARSGARVFLVTFVMLFIASPFIRAGSRGNRWSTHNQQVSWIDFILDEETYRHLVDLQQQWLQETIVLSTFQQRWVVWMKTRWFEIQVIWALVKTKLQEMLGMHRL